ncbi:MAG: SAM-dependent methyltransferase [bacterium]
MDINTKRRLINSYQTKNHGFLVHDEEQLKKIYKAYNIDPHSLDRRIFDIESLSHFSQKGVKELFNKLNIEREDNVLSVGEGNGAPSRLLAKLVDCKITGVDINQDQIEKAYACSKLHGVENNVEYFLQNAEELDLPEKDYNKAYFNETICHWENKKQAFARIYNHLKKDSKIGCNLWLRGNKGDLNDAYDKVPTFRGLYEPRIWFQLSLEEITKLFKSVGFKLVEKEDVTDDVDARMLAKFKALKLARTSNPVNYEYMAAMGENMAILGENYYKGMLDTAHDYLRYGRLIMKK